MDGKKKRNRKKKGNQGKNTGDAVTNADEAVPQSHNDDLAPKENYSGADADDAVSSVGEGTQYQNHEQTPHANQNVANVDETISPSVGEVIPCDENHEPTMTQENHKVSNTVYADQRSIGMSDSTVELDKDRLYEAKLDKLHDTIKQLEDEKGLWLQKMNKMESEIEKLHNKVGYHAQNEVILEEKLNNLQNGHDMLVKKEEVLDNKVKCVEDVNGVLTHQETFLKERLSGLEETNKALQEQVKVLDEASKSTVEENQQLLVSVDELESRLQTLEAKIALTEASITKEVPKNEVMNQTDLAGSFLHKQTAGFMTVISKGNELTADRGLNSSLVVTSDNIYSHVSNIPVGAYASDHADETSAHFPEATSSNGAGQSLMNAITGLEISGEVQYRGDPVLVPPRRPTPRHALYLSNLDDQRFLRFSIKYMYVFPAGAAVPCDALRSALAEALVDYYPLAGRLRPGDVGEEGKLAVDCNAEGALFAEGSLPGLAAADFLRGGGATPHKSWRKLLYRVDAHGFVAVPPLVVQVTHLGCGGMVLCTAINHCLCDGIGTAQFLHAWARAARSDIAGGGDHPVVHDRRALRPRCPPRVEFTHPEYHQDAAADDKPTLLAHLLGQPLSPVSLTFTGAHLGHLKKQLLLSVPALKCCTSFEALAATVWRAWVRALDPPAALRVKLLFSVNARRRLKPELPQGYYGNGFVLGCAESTAGQVAAVAAPATVIRLVQEAKERVDDDYVRSMVDLLEERRVSGGAKPDLSASLVISAWTRLGLEDLDFGAGTPAHMGPLTSEIYCVFVPVAGDPGGVTVLVSVPQAAADKFEHYCCNPVDPSGVEETDGGAMAGMLERDEQQQPCHGHEIKIDY